MIEKCLIEHCAPTLASLKAANLFNACCEEGENIDLQLGHLEPDDESKRSKADGSSQMEESRTNLRIP